MSRFLFLFFPGTYKIPYLDKDYQLKHFDSQKSVNKVTYVLNFPIFIVKCHDTWPDEKKNVTVSELRNTVLIIIMLRFALFFKQA